MSDAIRRIADAVLYEGYLLWPYRRSALKNQQRWNFGCVMPPAWSADHPDEASTMSTQLLLEGGDDAAVRVTLRFLHVVHRQVFDAGGHPVAELAIDGAQYLTWEEATEREITAGGMFAIAAGSRREQFAGGSVEHTWEGLSGSVRLALDDVGSGMRRVTVVVTNTTLGDHRPTAPDLPTATTGTLRAAALTRAFCSTHLVLRATDGTFLSPLDALASRYCRQERLWPVLIGEAPDRSAILASAIMLEEYPSVAAESPGDLFDGGEVDQLLTLNILGMTDAEKAEMRASDPRARAILERTEAMTAPDLMRLHGRRTVGQA